MRPLAECGGQRAVGEGAALDFATPKLSSASYRITLLAEPPAAASSFISLPVKHSLENDFGLVIAYVVPGAVALWGAGYLFPPIRAWFGASADSGPSIGGFLFVTLGAIGAGVLVSAVRWAVVDRIYHATGIREPRWNFSRLPGRLHAFLGVVENHYKFFQFYANSLVALTFTFVARLLARGVTPGMGLLTIAFLAAAVVLVLASRDALRKYYLRSEMVLRSSRSR